MGNRLVSVSDEGRHLLGADLFGFSDGTEEEIEYEYDENGNTMKDLNRKVSSIQYNSLNLRQRREDGLHLSKEQALCLRFAPSLHQEHFTYGSYPAQAGVYKGMILYQSSAAI